MRHFDSWGFLPLFKDVVLVLVPLAAGAWASFKTRHAHSRPSAQGTIMSARVQSSTDSYILRWAADFTYSYVVNGEYYSGFHQIQTRSKHRAEERIVGWKGRMVVVRYSLDKHDLSALLKGDQPGGQLGN